MPTARVRGNGARAISGWTMLQKVILCDPYVEDRVYTIWNKGDCWLDPRDKVVVRRPPTWININSLANYDKEEDDDGCPDGELSVIVGDFHSPEAGVIYLPWV